MKDWRVTYDDTCGCCKVSHTRFAIFSIIVILQAGLSVDANVDYESAFFVSGREGEYLRLENRTPVQLLELANGCNNAAVYI